jgi:hypothetical protein
MTLSDLMRALRDQGATLTLHGDGVKVRAPAPLPAGLMEAMRTHKAEIIAALRDQAHQAPRTATELVAALRQAPCHGACGKWTPFGWECLECRTSVGESAP